MNIRPNSFSSALSYSRQTIQTVGKIVPSDQVFTTLFAATRFQKDPFNWDARFERERAQGACAVNEKIHEMPLDTQSRAA